MSDCTNCGGAGVNRREFLATSSALAITAVLTAGPTVAISGAGFRCPNHGATFNASGAWTGGERTNGLFEFTVASNTAAGTITITS